MFDRTPKDYNNLEDWFLYFRLTKFLPAMPRKFEEQIAKVSNAKEARMVMTGYAAASIDVVFFCGGFYPKNQFARELEDSCSLKPAQLLLLNVNELAKPLKRADADQLRERLTEAGFTVAPDGTITSFERPAGTPKPRPRREDPPPPKPPTFSGPMC
jgi:hypothetical protein